MNLRDDLLDTIQLHYQTTLFNDEHQQSPEKMSKTNEKVEKERDSFISVEETVLLKVGVRV